MTTKEHRKRHVKLHRGLDELLADFLGHTTLLPSKTPIMALVNWSHQQTHTPDEDEIPIIREVKAKLGRKRR